MAPSHQWTPPSISLIKINVDAAMGPHCSSIASVARDWRGELVFGCSKRVNTIFPLQVEAEVIKWTLTLATNLEFKAIIVESESQVCSNLLSDLEAAPPPPFGEPSPFVMTLDFSWHLLIRFLFVGCLGCAIWLLIL